MPNRIATATHTYSTTTTPPPSLPPTTTPMQSQTINNTNTSTTTNAISSSPVAHGCVWRLRERRSQAHNAAHSRRKRRRDDDATCKTSTSAAPASYNHLPHNNNNNNNSSSSSSNHLSKPARSTAATWLGAATQALSHPSTTAYVAALLALSTCCSLCVASPCDTHSWWDPVKDKCIPCTVCQGEMIPLRPCQLHRDTICGSIYDLKIDWVVLAKTEPNWKERRKTDDGGFDLEQQLTQEELQQLHDEVLPTDWQTVALFLAVLACLLFFIAAACILVHHMRQWRRMERRLDKDVEELSTKLMAKLAEVQSLEGGTFFIGNADALRVPTTFQPQHVLLPEKPAKHHERRILKTLQPGNVYIEENSSKG